MDPVIDNYLKLLTEGTPKDKRPASIQKNQILFHGSIIQNLKVIDPRKWKDALLKEHIKAIWASWDRTFAAMFCINWRKDFYHITIGTDWGFYFELPVKDEQSCFSWGEFDNSEKPHCKESESNPKWMVVVHPKYVKYLTKPCSLYLIKGENWKIQGKEPGYNWEWPEVYSKEPAEVIKEIKYPTVSDAYRRNGVKVEIYKNYPDRPSKKWLKTFASLKV